MISLSSSLFFDTRTHTRTFHPPSHCAVWAGQSIFLPLFESPHLVTVSPYFILTLCGVAFCTLFSFITFVLWLSGHVRSEEVTRLLSNLRVHLVSLRAAAAVQLQFCRAAQLLCSSAQHLPVPSMHPCFPRPVVPC